MKIRDYLNKQQVLKQGSLQQIQSLVESLKAKADFQMQNPKPRMAPKMQNSKIAQELDEKKAENDVFKHQLALQRQENAQLQQSLVKLQIQIKQVLEINQSLQENALQFKELNEQLVRQAEQQKIQQFDSVIYQEQKNEEQKVLKSFQEQKQVEDQLMLIQEMKNQLPRFEHFYFQKIDQIVGQLRSFHDKIQEAYVLMWTNKNIQKQKGNQEENEDLGEDLQLDEQGL